MNALSKSKPEGTARKRLKLTPTAPEPGDLHVSETVNGFDSSAGRVLVRTRRYNFFARVGGRGPVPSCRYEVAIRTVRSAADGRGFVVICRGLGDRTAGQSHLDAYLQACDWIERTIEAEGIRRTASDREAVPSSRQPAPPMPDGRDAQPSQEAVEVAPGLAPKRGGTSRGHALHRVLGGAGVTDHYAFAAEALSAYHGRPVELVGPDGRPSLSGLSADECAAVVNHLTQQRRELHSAKEAA